MPSANSLTLAAPRQHLRQLALIRSLLLGALWLALLVGSWLYPINSGLLLAVLCCMSLLQLATLLRLKKPLPVTETEFFTQLLLDILGLSLWFYASGGATNPFISYLLVPVCIAAATLPWRYTWAISLLSIAAYSGLLFFYRAFPLFAVEHQHQHSPVSWHILGMWFNFFISTSLITYFVVKMANNLRAQQETLSQLREDELRNQQLMAIATLAAGTAHEINTPLNTMALLLTELQAEHNNQPGLSGDLELLSQQVNHCAAVLKKLVSDASSATQGNFTAQPLQIFCEAVIDRWQLLRPGVQFQLDLSGELLAQEVRLDPRLEQAIINLLNNAADASPQPIGIAIAGSAGNMTWTISDSGAGLAPELAANMGTLPVSTKAHGLGIGMVITQATLKHYGGSISQTANTPCGTITRLTIPLQPQ